MLVPPVFLPRWRRRIRWERAKKVGRRLGAAQRGAGGRGRGRGQRGDDIGSPKAWGGIGSPARSFPFWQSPVGCLLGSLLESPHQVPRSGGSGALAWSGCKSIWRARKKQKVMGRELGAIEGKLLRSPKL